MVACAMCMIPPQSAMANQSSSQTCKTCLIRDNHGTKELTNSNTQKQNLPSVFSLILLSGSLYTVFRNLMRETCGFFMLEQMSAYDMSVSKFQKFCEVQTWRSLFFYYKHVLLWQFSSFFFACLPEDH